MADDKHEQYVIILRHGERRDSLADAPHEADPPLTERGKEDIEQAAQRLSKSVGTSLAAQLRVVSSPFLRTMKTAARLHECGIGPAAAAVSIDNTLCEVFGPTRIKSATPPDLHVEGLGKLPDWGESLEQATARFQASFLANASGHREHLLLVTHGDALSAVLSQFYPRRTVYNAEFLSFIVFRRTSDDAFAVHDSFGVDWLEEDE